MNIPLPKWSKHAEGRAKESPIKLPFAKKMLKSATMYNLKKHIESWKFARYGMKQMKLAYRVKDIQLIYTVNQETGDVITFTVKDKNTNQVWGKDLFWE